MMSLLGGNYIAAKGERAVRNEKQKLHALEDRQRSSAFGMASQWLALGKNLWDTYQANTELIDYAEGRGFKTESGTLANVFSSPEFSLDGENVTREQVRMTRQLDQWESSKNMLDFLKPKPSLNDEAFRFDKNKKLYDPTVDINERNA